MIKQSAIGLDSRNEADCYLDTGYLPIITSNMYSVVDNSNYKLFLESKINVALPRKTQGNIENNTGQLWMSYSLLEFEEEFLNTPKILQETHYVILDCANGAMPKLHNLIRRAKALYLEKLVIMSGNCGSVECFISLAKTGVDYIRVGIGGGSGCNTTNNTGVGQEDLSELIKECCYSIIVAEENRSYLMELFHQSRGKANKLKEASEEEGCFAKVKIVADGISSYIKLCQQKYNFNDNGYAAIIKLLNSGADLVMIGGLFAQCIESAGEKGVKTFFNTQSFSDWQLERIQRGSFGSPTIDTPLDYMRIIKRGLEVKISGMSTIDEQKKYKESTNLGTQDLSVPRLKPSEGSTKWVPVRWTLKEWLQGSDNQDEYPYLNGFVNSLKSAMSYTGSRTLNEFKS